MRVLTRLLATSTLLVLALAALAAATAGASQTSRTVGHLYVNDNTAGANTIAGVRPPRRRHADRAARLPVRRRRRRQRRRRRLAGLAAAQRRRPLPARRRCRPATRSRSCASAPTDRSGRRSTWSPPAACSPVSIAVHGPLVYVANAGAGRQQLHRLPARPVRPPASARAARRSRCPTARSRATSCSTATGRSSSATRVGTSLIDSFRVGLRRSADRRARLAVRRPGPRPVRQRVPSDQPEPAVRVQRPRRRRQRHGLGLRRRPDGSLTSIGDSPFADLQTAPCWVEISHDGRYLFAVNTAVATISRFSIAPGGALTLLGSTPLSEPRGPGAGRCPPGSRPGARSRSSTAAPTRSPRSPFTAAT